MTDLAIPRYRTIEQSLRERIATLRPGDALPSDTALCAEFGVSRMTARSAMQLLADEGLVVRLPGRGSFVAEPATHRRADRLMSFTSEMARRGRRPTSRIVNREIRPAPRLIATELDVPEGAAIVYLRRVRCADEVPIALETTVLIGETSPAVMAADLRHDSLHAALVRAGWILRRGTAIVNAVPATADDARLLEVPKGSPILVERRVILDAQGRPIEVTESRYGGDRYAMNVRFDVEVASA
ncbi:MAG: GntR family transcriptional regulator [Chloroflexota bacterium]